LLDASSDILLAKDRTFLLDLLHTADELKEADIQRELLDKRYIERVDDTTMSIAIRPLPIANSNSQLLIACVAIRDLQRL